jgi:hypothetical protein
MNERLRRVGGRSIVTVIAAAIAAAIASGQARVTAPVHELTFTFTTRQPIVPVSVNGGPAVPFVIDTGASIHLIDREIARQARVVGGREGQLSGGGQQSAPTSFVDGVTLAIGDLSWTDQRAAVTDLGYPTRKHFAGLLGAPILMRYVVQFAFPARTLRLIDPTAYRPNPRARAIPFELLADLPVVQATIDAGSGPIPARLMVDTAAATSVDLNRPFVDEHRLLDAIGSVAPLDRPAAIGGTAPFVYGTGRRLTLGGLTFERPRLGLSRATSGSSSRRERDGIIGNDLLQDFVMTVDYGRRIIALERAR